MKDVCGAAMKHGGTCRLNDGHKGHHRFHVWYCDGCSNPRTGTVAAIDNAEGLSFCWVCVKAPKRYNNSLENEQ